MSKYLTMHIVVRFTADDRVGFLGEEYFDISGPPEAMRTTVQTLPVEIFHSLMHSALRDTLARLEPAGADTG